MWVWVWVCPQTPMGTPTLCTMRDTPPTGSKPEGQGPATRQNRKPPRKPNEDVSYVPVTRGDPSLAGRNDQTDDDGTDHNPTVDKKANTNHTTRKKTASTAQAEDSDQNSTTTSSRLGATAPTKKNAAGKGRGVRRTRVIQANSGRSKNQAEGPPHSRIEAESTVMCIAWVYPWVSQSIPIPIPTWVAYPCHGYGFCMGIMSTHGYG
ncbi:uncharacterized protein B0H18DRAFT_960969 [Fomitopsis serialis]|uniref:uncharacterized protein n=1 Tax=Fomitopsis serialis TaxID=139415 RepID=UPI002008E2CB|nr:uncharacterized protein B0H18DRAFT_960969 [Neoantrodia serialis]KAH9912543.1 hypothetical protein B0H18DRAFT_960969 [Neoantrodia serialis]